MVTKYKFDDVETLAIYVIDEIIKNCKREFRNEIIKYCVDNYDDSLVKHKMKKFINTKYIFPSVPPMSIDYWLARGYSNDEAIVQQFEYRKSKKKVSPFSLDHWLKKINPNTGELYTVDEAESKRNSMRPIRKEYWIENFGYDEETATIKANETKSENNRKGSQTSKCSTKKKVNNRLSVDYYLLRGYDENTAKDIISNLQRTFSKDICIEKYGYERGVEIWKERQIKWQKSIIDNNDIDEINAMKNPLLSYYGLPNDEIRQRVCSLVCSDDAFIAFNENELLEYINGVIFDDEPYLVFTDYTYVLDKLRSYNYMYISKDFDIIDFLKSKVGFIEDKSFEIKKSKYSKFFYRKDGMTLKSSSEINFYIWSKKYGIDFLYGERYNRETQQRYDFYLPKYDIIVEIAGRMQDNEYYQTMFSKQEKFGSVIVESKDVKKFLREVLDGNFNRDDYKILPKVS